jgi:hypothetical protein
MSVRKAAETPVVAAPERERAHGFSAYAEAAAAHSVHIQRSCDCGAAAGISDQCASCAAEETLGIQPKLTISTPNDAYEIEADRIADRIVSGGIPAPTAPVDATPLMRRAAESSASQGSAGNAGAPSGRFGAAVSAVASGGMPLSAADRAYFEPRLGRDLSHVRLHTDDSADRAAAGIDARAYTLRNHIAFRRGEHSPTTTEGRRLLAHELVHTLQQSAAPPLPERAADRGVNASAPQISRLPSRDHLQRQCPPPVRRRGGAAGCGVCMGGNFGEIGTLVHQLVQYAFFAQYPELVPSSGGMEMIVPTVPEGETAPFNPEVDLSLEREEHGLRVIYIGEIKPFDDAGRQRQQARDKLDDYARELRAGGLYDEVRLMRLAPPPEFPFIEIPYPPGCPRQLINVCRIEPGIYQYYCHPSWADQRRDPRCRCGRRRQREREREREQQRRQDRERDHRPVEPIPLPHEGPRSGRRPQPERRPDDVEEPPVVPVPPVTVPAPEQQPGGEPETAPESEPEGPRVIPFPGPRAPVDVPDEQPEALPEAARVALAAAAATAILVGLKQLARRLPAAALRRVIAPLEAAAVVALVVLYSDRVEARPGSGDSPLEALFDAMQQDGIPVSDEMRARIEADPALKAALERAAAGGSMSEAQRAIGQRTMEIIAANPDEFSEEDLRLLAEAMSAASGGSEGAQPTVETLRRMIDARREGRPITDEIPRQGGDTGGAAVGETDTESSADTETASRPDTSDEAALESDRPSLPHVSAELQEALAASGEASRLFRAMSGRLGRGPEITDEVVRRFLDVVPADLTSEEADALIARLAPVEGQSLDEILQRLRQAVDNLRAGDTAEESDVGEAPGVEPEAPTTDEGTPPSQEQQGAAEVESGLTESEAIERIRAFLARRPAPGRFHLPADATVVPGATFTILMASGRNGLTAGFVTFTFVRQIEGLRWLATLHPTRLYDAEGNPIETFPSEPTQTEIVLPTPRRPQR